MDNQTNLKPMHCLSRENHISAITIIIVNKETLLTIGDREGNLEIVSLENFRTVWRKELDSSLIAVKTIKEQSCLITHTRSSVVQYWEINKTGLIETKRFQYDYGRLCGLEVTESLIIVPTAEKGKVRILDYGFSEVKTLNVGTESGEIMTIKTIASDTCLIGFETKVIRYNFKLELTESEVLLNDCVMCLCPNKKFNKVICGTAENLSVFNSDEISGKLENKVVIPTNTGISCIDIRQDSKIVACGCWNGRVRVYSAKTLKFLAFLDFHRKTVTGVIFVDAQSTIWRKNLLIVACENGTVSVWDIYN
ncbi:uncharacterized protein LOC136033703 isoform X2 [Artemia franciscana]|uniref:Uncharacterized protein n=2 Tax=Artemia franciscana TaxID=6661 RepID=A0AA88I3F2_ARTSF|nr:hypothetical protein QYM36_001805 [Artemia franciscana]KAK2723266.1 hypothetical protein QYM36_001805 [Artemia franciscana]KAK2723267.1 hypothetical protein QYM36_001805 [Artemia franciscana]